MMGWKTEDRFFSFVYNGDKSYATAVWYREVKKKLRSPKALSLAIGSRQRGSP